MSNRDNFSNDPGRLALGQKQWTLILEGQSLDNDEIIISISHTWAFNSVEAVTNLDPRALRASGMKNYRPIALFAGHLYDVLPADFTRPLPLPPR